MGIAAIFLAVNSAAEWRVIPLADNTKASPNRWALPCDPAVWFQDRVQERGEPIVDAQCGDLRGDGVTRMYAHLGQSHQYVEMENSIEGPHAVKDVFNAGAFAPLVTFGMGSIAPKPSIFMSEGVRVREIYWDGKSWVTKLIESSYDHIPKAMIAEDLRGDRKKHLFADCGQLLIDYFLDGQKWASTQYRIRPSYKYTKTMSANIGVRPGVGRGIIVKTDTDNEFIGWFPEQGPSNSLMRYTDKLRKLISPSNEK